MVLYKVDVFFCLEIYYRNKRPQGAKQFFFMLTVYFSSSFEFFTLSYVPCEVLFMLYTNKLFNDSYCFQCHPFAILIDIWQHIL